MDKKPKTKSPAPRPAPEAPRVPPVPVPRIGPNAAPTPPTADAPAAPPPATITDIPALTGKRSQVELTPIEPGRAYVRIHFDEDTGQYGYEVLEPGLAPKERQALDLVRDTLVRTLDARPEGGPQDWARQLVRKSEEILRDHDVELPPAGRDRVAYYLVRDLVGYGPIDLLMRDPMIEDISCDGPRIPLYVFHRGHESVKTNVSFPDEDALDGFVLRLAQRSGKTISLAEPLLDATLPDKSRLQASLSKEVTTRGSSFTIRRFRSEPFTPPDLIRLGTIDAHMAAFFWLAIEEGAPIIFAGGTASGKTSTLNAVSTFIPPQKKIVSLEDTREINLAHDNWIAGLTRPRPMGAATTGPAAQSIDMYKLLESALRQRPEYLLVGEVRGPEALTLFQAMATGHATYSTLHADSVSSAVYRLENPPINVPRIMLQTLAAMAIQIQTRVKGKAVRRVRELVEITGIDPDTKDLLTNTVFSWDQATDTFSHGGKSRILDQVATKRGWTPERVDQEWRTRTRILEWMAARGIRRIDDVSRIVASYYTKPQELVARLDAEDAQGGRGA